jgi:hypothetical protein
VRSDRDSRRKRDLGDYSDAACFGCSRNVIVLPVAQFARSCLSGSWR